MAKSKIIIEFLEVPQIGDSFSFQETTSNKNIVYTFQEQRLAFGQVKTPSWNNAIPTGYFEFIPINFRIAFNLDYNFSDQYLVTYTTGEYFSGIGTVTIEALYDNAVFVKGSTPSYINVTIVNQAFVIPIEITNVEFSQAINKCGSIKVNVTTSVLATKISSPVVINNNINNPFSFDILRGQTIDLLVENANGKKASKSIVLPSLLNAADFSFQINSSPNGATVIVNSTNLTGLSIQYSLNNQNWQSSNVFGGLATGDFTLYVKDQFGCSFSKIFSVNEFGIQDPYFFISKSNSIRYAERIIWGDSSNYKTDENTLSCEVDVLLPKKETQLFQSTDLVPTQFLSNYSNIVAKVIKSDLSEVNIPINKMTNNIGIKDKRDARKYNFGSGKTGIYFISGNKYDYNTGAVNDTYSLNGLLPEWAVIGNYIIISNAWFKIEDIFFDENKNADVIVFSQNYSGSETSIIVGSIFNRFEYEVYEFKVDMSNYVNQKISVKLINSDPYFPTRTYLSEQIWCKVKHERTLEIKYKNKSNTDIFYSTGIEFILRIPYLNIKGKPDEDSETHKTDTNVILLNADLYEADEFVFQPVTKELWRKIMIALSHGIVSIDGVGYVKNGNFNTEGPLNDTNWYVLTAIMLKSGNVYSSKSSNSPIIDDGNIVEVPGLIKTEGGFVGY